MAENKKSKNSSSKAEKAVKAAKDPANEAVETVETAAGDIADTAADTIETAAESAPEAAENIIESISGEPEISGDALPDASGEAAVVPELTPKEKLLLFWNNYGKKGVKVLSYLIPLAIFIAVVALMVYYITVAYKKEFHADCTDTIMWANASIEGDAVYDKDFGYACFLPFGINVPMQLFIHWFGLSMKAHIWGMMTYFILLTGFFCLMLSEMHWDIRAICLGASGMLAMTTSSQKMREIFWQHTIYYSLGILFIVIGLFLYFRIMNLAERQRKLGTASNKAKINFLRILIAFVILLVFIMFTATDGISALSIFAAPFVGAVFIEHFVDTNNKIISKKSLITVVSVGLFGLMIILGGKLNEKWVGDLVAGYAQANSNFSPMGDWTEHYHSFPLAWIKLNGVKDMGGVPLNEKEGVTNLIYIASAMILLVMPIIATFFYPKFKKSRDAKMLRIAIWMHWAAFGINLLGYIIGVIAAADWRLTPAIGTSLIISILFIHWAIANKTNASRIVAILAIPMVMVSYLNMKEIKKMPKDGYTENNLYGLTEFLEDEGLSYGYATFWNANAITLLSDSNVKVRDVNIDQNGVSKRIYQSSENWYKDQEDQEDYFLLTNPYEYQTLMDIQSPLLNEAMETKSVFVNNTEYKVLVFDHNIIYY